MLCAKLAYSTEENLLSLSISNIGAYDSAHSLSLLVLALEEESEVVRERYKSMSALTTLQIAVAATDILSRLCWNTLLEGRLDSEEEEVVANQISFPSDEK